jgi:hypothetical protein
MRDGHGELRRIVQKSPVSAPRGRYAVGLGRGSGPKEDGCMKRAFGALMVALVVAACGDPAPAGGGGANVTTAKPPVSAVWFGTAFDPTSLALTDKGNSFKAGTPTVAIGTLLSARPPEEMSVKVETSGNVRATLPVAPVGVGNTLAVDLTSANLGPGSYLISFVDKTGKALASASFNVSP